MQDLVYRLSLLAVLMLPACSHVTYDETQSEHSRDLIAGCYQTNIESSLYRRPSTDLEPHAANATFLIQTGLPFNEWQYSRYGADWEPVVEIPIGSRFRVTRVFSQNWGRHGRYWLLYGRFANREISHREFIIPSGNYAYTGHRWITPASPDNKPAPIRFKRHFAKPCD